jgi:hypothetical protein
MVMKKTSVFSLLLGVFFVVGLAEAQIITPDASPFATTIQKIGFTDVRIEYSRPSARGRVVFGDVVPYDKIWRVGANASTKIYNGQELTIQDEHKLPPGVYAIYAVPGKEEWTIIFSRDA